LLCLKVEDDAPNGVKAPHGGLHLIELI
jgi:hypothetical protein